MILRAPENAMHRGFYSENQVSTLIIDRMLSPGFGTLVGFIHSFAHSFIHSFTHSFERAKVDPRARHMDF